MCMAFAPTMTTGDHLDCDRYNYLHVAIYVAVIHKIYISKGKRCLLVALMPNFLGETL